MTAYTCLRMANTIFRCSSGGAYNYIKITTLILLFLYRVNNPHKYVCVLQIFDVVEIHSKPITQNIFVGLPICG